MTAPEPAEGRPVRIPLRPATILLVALVVVAVSFFVVLTRLPWIVGLVLMLVAVVVTIWATLSAVVRRSLFVAPLAVCLVAVGNPAVLAGAGAFVERNVGVVTVSFDRGVVPWALYPGIAGWEAPQAPEVVDTPALAQTVQRALRSAVGALSADYAYTWQVGDGRVGIAPIANGFGGDSMFQRIDAPRWTTSDFDESAEQRAAIVAAAAASAAELGLMQATEAAGDVDTGDGTREWTDEGQTFTLTLEGQRVALSYTGGPFLAPQSLPGEFQRSMRAYEALTLPPPIVTPNLP
ncbi:hypothetical protein GCM10009775_13680 [Microbacterium aoyamense]|uniref:DUF3298 domain-containing protein n=1 Tax=Microbacterium aoyamense TaxID=344166 RepID=A0ABN2PLE5_9MICO|nr:hypothetical protein [Microbacterium aoyamense]